MTNFFKYYIRNSLYNAAIMLTGGTVIQIFMANAGMRNEIICIYTSLVNIITVCVNLFLSKYADTIADTKKNNYKNIIAYVNMSFRVFTAVFHLSADTAFYTHKICHDSCRSITGISDCFIFYIRL